MAGLYGNYSLYSGLFGSGSSNSNNDIFSSFYSNLGQYASVKSGAYMKAAKAYYGKSNTVDTSTKNSTSSVSSTKGTTGTDSLEKTDSADAGKTTSTTKAYSRTNKDNIALNSVKTEASELKESAKKLLDKGKDAVFAEGKEYDKDAAYEAVSSFVKEYNDTVTALGSTSNTEVSNVGDSMKRSTRAMSDSLSKAGVTVGTDGKLSIDEKAFKNADESTVKSLFNGSGSVTGVVSSSSSRIEQQAANQISKLNVSSDEDSKKNSNSNNSTSTFNNSTYNNSGSYYNYYNSGLLYNGYY